MLTQGRGGMLLSGGRGVALAVTIYLVAVLIGAYQLNRLTDRLVQSNARESAAEFLNAISEFRTLYTSEVVARLGDQAVEVTHDYATRPGAIPLPATLSILLGNRLAERVDGAQVRLFSDYPFPWRKATGGARDEFQQTALRLLRADPGEPAIQFENVDGQPSVRYAIADVMRASCVHCHNNHPLSPKTDWREGEVRGVLEAVLPLDAAIARTTAEMDSLWWLAGVATALSGLVLLVLSYRLSRGAKALREYAHELGLATSQRSIVERDLVQTRTRKGVILDSVDDAIVAMDAEGCISEFNLAAERTFGHTRDEALGRRVVDVLIPARSRARFTRELADFRTSGTASVIGRSIEGHALRAGGTEIPVEMTISIAQVEDDVSITACIRDITERLQAREELNSTLRESEQRKHELEQFNRLAVDREIQMIELKSEVNELLVQVNASPRYDVSWSLPTADATGDDSHG